MSKKKARSKKEILTIVAIAALVLIIAFLYIKTIRNGGDTAALTQAIVESVVGEDASQLIGQAVGVDVSDSADNQGDTEADIDSDSSADTSTEYAETSGDANDSAGIPGSASEASGNSSDGAGSSDANYVSYRFRNNNLLTQHYEKHGIEMGFKSKEAYEKAASDVINNPDALHKTEKEDGDFVYYVEATNEFVVLSTDGYIRTYFLPDAGIKYYNRQ